ncbi:unnamed protein product [Penicillium nalgiovense]|nr:unnamed protein product [Penicillium nalgiovense]
MDESSVESNLTIKREVFQTPKLVRAYHQRGIFSTPKVEDVTAAVNDWERTHQDTITKLVALIKCILRVTRNWDGSSTVHYDPLKNKLEITKIERTKVLPEDLNSRWGTPSPPTSQGKPLCMAQKLLKKGAILGDLLRHLARMKPFHMGSRQSRLNFGMFL